MLTAPTCLDDEWWVLLEDMVASSVSHIYQRYTVSQKLLHPWFIRWQVDKRQHDKILSYIELGKREGATLLTGGKPLYEKRYYIEPPVFTDFFLVIKTM